jgi:phospholipid/cholesterol/gamma-HCH transport system ATP-binding protein
MQHAPEKHSDEPIVRCENLVAGYGDTVVLDDINLEIHRGEITTLLGGSGSGKSTLMKTMIGLIPPLDGKCMVLGEELYDMPQKERSEFLSNVGMMFQYGALMGSRTIRDNIALPLEQHTKLPNEVIDEMIRMRLSLVGLDGLQNRLPSDISGGQRKRIALARATIMDPQIIFADEPSAGLDPIVAAGLDDLLRRMQRLFKMTMVVVTHELESIKILADRVVMIHDGDIRATGTVEELAQSEDEVVHDFFHRIAPEYLETGGESVLSMLTQTDQRA